MIIQPVMSPATVAKPYFLPFTMLWVSTKILSDPGEIAKTTTEDIKSKKISIIFKKTFNKIVILN